MKILMITAEMDGIIKTGGLADFALALPKALIAAGHDVRVILPKYKQVVLPLPMSETCPAHLPSSDGSHAIKMPDANQQTPGRTVEIKNNSLYFNLNHRDRYGCLVHSISVQGIGVRLLEHHDFFSRDGIYDDGSYAYPDNPLRFAFLCKAALEQCLYEKWIPDVVHCNDWQTALAPYYLKEHYAYHPGMAKVKSILTLHNGAYQGKSDPVWVDALGILPQRFTSELMEEHGLLNLLKCGIMYADAVNAVSPGYCQELLAPETSHGLWHYLNQRKDHFTGILNGCDYSQWNPDTDPLLPHGFSADDMAGKALCKKALQAEMNLPENSDVPLLGLIARLVEQKGFDYLIPALERLLYEDVPVQLVLLGSGDFNYGSRLHHLQNRYPHKMSFVNGYDNALSHLIEAGSDFFMMPSLFEPCGLNQLYSLAYGTLPIIRATGGLKDTVVGLDGDHGNAPRGAAINYIATDNSPQSAANQPISGISTAENKAQNTAENTATGISFIHPDAESCYGALKQAVSLYLDHRTLYDRMQQRAMGQMFTWDDSARAYEALYKAILIPE
ncbi:glycogen synthase [Desulfocicer niacini]